MKGSEFVEANKSKNIQGWEAAAVELAKSGEGIVNWPMVPIHLSSPGHEATLNVSSDYFSVGDPSDFLRLPLTPSAAQTIANFGNFLLPTPKIAYEIAKQAEVKLIPTPQVNKGENLLEFAKHNATVEAQRAGRTGLITGHKKDVVISNIYKPKKVLIYGWFYPPGAKVPAGFSNPIQARSNIHYDGFADYSHGIRFISPVMKVDGQDMMTEDVMRDPVLSKLVSDEGIVRTVRYPAPNAPAEPPYRPVDKKVYEALNDVYPRPNTSSYADMGLSVLAEESAAKKNT